MIGGTLFGIDTENFCYGLTGRHKVNRDIHASIVRYIYFLIDYSLELFNFLLHFKINLAELVHDVAMQNNKVILGVDRAGFVGEDGRSHQGILDVAFLKTIPGTVIYSPSSYEELGIALHQAVDGDGHVVAVRYPRGYEGYLPKNYKALPEPVSIFGKKSSRVTIVTYGSLFSNAVKAQEKLKEYDIDVKIIKLNRVWPIDELAIKEAPYLRENYVEYAFLLNTLKDYSKMKEIAVPEAKKYDTILFFEEGIKAGGAGETFATMLMEGAYKGDFSHIAVEDTFVHHASIKELEEERRLMYVAITRAKKNLFVVLTRQRMLFGQTQCFPPSRFLKEINLEHLHRMGGERVVEKKPAAVINSPAREYARRNISSALSSGIKKPDSKIKKSGLSPAELSVGMKVTHDRFGEGVIIKVEPVAGDALVTVDFDGLKKTK